MPKPERHVLVCTNTRPQDNPRGSCGAKNSEAVFDALKERVRDADLHERVIVNRTSCLKHCSRGVTVVVYPENVWYAGVGLADVDEICTSHLRDGRVVERLLMPDIPWE